MKILKDTYGSSYIQWTKGRNQRQEPCQQRAWVQHRSGEDDWAGTGRYLNVVRCNQKGNPAGNATDFPIYSTLPDEQVLLAFVHSVNAITGCQPND